MAVEVLPAVCVSALKAPLPAADACRTRWSAVGCDAAPAGAVRPAGLLPPAGLSLEKRRPPPPPPPVWGRAGSIGPRWHSCTCRCVMTLPVPMSRRALALWQA